MKTFVALENIPPTLLHTFYFYLCFSMYVMILSYSDSWLLAQRLVILEVTAPLPVCQHSTPIQWFLEASALFVSTHSLANQFTCLHSPLARLSAYFWSNSPAWMLPLGFCWLLDHLPVLLTCLCLNPFCPEVSLILIIWFWNSVWPWNLWYLPLALPFRCLCFWTSAVLWIRDSLLSGFVFCDSQLCDCLYLHLVFWILCFWSGSFCLPEFGRGFGVRLCVLLSSPSPL